jgi:ribosomal protein S27AE
MPQTYIHLSGKDIDKEIMKIYGIEEEEEKNEKKECQRCYKTYQGDENFCPRCGAAFDYESKISKDELRESGREYTQEKLNGPEKEETEELVREVIAEIQSE